MIYRCNRKYANIMKESDSMKKYLYETHCHTFPASACGSWSPEEVADFYKSRGYVGVMITNHFFNGNTGIDGLLPWEEKVELFCSDYERARKRGDEIGIDVFFGFEYNRGGAEFLIYGLDKEWLLRHSDIMSMGMRDLYALIRRSGGVMIQAHPFRQAGYLERIAIYPDYCDGAEAINTSNASDNNENAIWYCKRFGLFMTCGSDSHWTGRDDLGGVYLPRRIEHISEYVRIIKEKEPIELYTQKDYGFEL